MYLAAPKTYALPQTAVTTDEVFSRIVMVFEAGDLLIACAWCGRVQIDGAWVWPPPAALAAIDERNTLSHSVCDECARRGEKGPS